jgi:UrcA family protein
MNAKFHSSTRSISFRTALAAIACGIALTTPAVADSNGEPLTKVVSYAGLNLNGEPGARVLYGRLRMAAAQVRSRRRRTGANASTRRLRAR